MVTILKLSFVLLFSNIIIFTSRSFIKLKAISEWQSLVNDSSSLWMIITYVIFVLKK